MRVSVLGNAGGGKSTLTRRLADAHDLRVFEVDKWQWTADFQQVPEAEYAPHHAAAIEGDAWIIDGMGTGPLLKARLARSTDIVLIDLPMWQHYWLVAERQRTWDTIPPEERPGGGAERPSTRDLFQMMDWIGTQWMPKVREWAKRAEGPETTLHHLKDIDEVADFSLPAQ